MRSSLCCMPDSKLQPKPERHFALLGYLSAFLLICLLWRMDFLALLGSMKLPISGIAAALAGALWMDVLLALVMLVLLLGTDRLGKTKRVVSHVLLLLGFAWVAIARIADGAYFYYSGNHVDRIALEHLQGDAFGMRLDSRITVYLILAALVATLALCLLLLAARVLRRMEKTEILRLVLAPLVGLCFSSWFFSLFSDATFGRDSETRSRLRVLQAAPEIAIPLLALSSGEEAVYRDRSFLLHPVVKKKLRKFGLKIDESKKYPLIKQTVFEKPHPFARTEHWLSKPNVIIIFFESFSAELTSVYSQRYPGLTPNLEDFAKVSLVVLDFFNSSTPTVTALTSSHASILPVTNTMTWFEKENNSGQKGLLSLFPTRSRHWRPQVK